jgi:molybdopterin-binding protein
MCEKQLSMKISARNQLKGKITKVEEGLITAKVTLDLGNNNIVSAIISKDAIADLDLKEGIEAIIATPCDCHGNKGKEKGGCGCNNHG